MTVTASVVDSPVQNSFLGSEQSVTKVASGVVPSAARPSA